MIIKTDGGSVYEFFEENGKTYFQKDSEKQLVTEMSELKLGEHLTIKYYPLDSKQDFPCMVITPCITEII